MLLLEEFMLASTNTELAGDHSIFFFFFAVSFRLPYGGSMGTKIVTVSLYQGFNTFD